MSQQYFMARVVFGDMGRTSGSSDRLTARAHESRHPRSTLERSPFFVDQHVVLVGLALVCRRMRRRLRGPAKETVAILGTAEGVDQPRLGEGTHFGLDRVEERAHTVDIRLGHAHQLGLRDIGPFATQECEALFDLLVCHRPLWQRGQWHGHGMRGGVDWRGPSSHDTRRCHSHFFPRARRARNGERSRERSESGRYGR